MSAPLAKGIIIAASVIVAAGIAIYESEQIRVWLDENRRRIAIALHNLGDGIQPQPQSEADLRSTHESNRRRRMDIVRRNRLALIRRARDEGVAVDLDALAALGLEDVDTPPSPTISAPSFDDMVGQDGKLRQGKGPEMEQRSASASSFAPVSDEGLRRRATGAAAFASGASFGTAFDDDMRMDVDVIGSSSRGFPRPVPINQGDHDSRQQESGVIHNSGAAAMPDHLIDVPVWADVPTDTQEQSRYKTDDELEAEIQEAIRRSLADVPASALQQPEESLLVNTSAQMDPFSDVHALQSSLHSSPWTQDLQGLDNSLYALPSPRIEPQSIPILSIDSPTTAPASAASVASFHSATADNRSETGGHDDETTDGMRTPKSATASAGDTDNDIDEVISIMSGEAVADDARSEAEMSEFSVVGVSTPGSWTDVDTDGEDEAANGSTMMQGVAPR